MAQRAVWQGTDLYAKHAARERSQSRTHHTLVHELAHLRPIHTRFQRRKKDRLLLSPYHYPSRQQDRDGLSAATRFQRVGRGAESSWIPRIRHLARIWRNLCPGTAAVSRVARLLCAPQAPLQAARQREHV